MAHQVQQMAYVGETPWHGLGNELTPQQPIEVWAEQSGMSFQILETPVRFMAESAGPLGSIKTFADQKVLYRSDTKDALSVVSNRYQVVQPCEVLEFYRDLTEVAGYELETAGVLKGGKKFWALARTGQSSALKGNDVVKGYLLLATSCDGTLATTATPTTVRVVCNNTLTIAVNGAVSAIKVPHNTRFDAQSVKQQLGIAVSQWDGFMYRMRTLAERKVKSHEAMAYFLRVLCEVDPNSSDLSNLTNERALVKVQSLYDGQGRGAELEAAKGIDEPLCHAELEVFALVRTQDDYDPQQAIDFYLHLLGKATPNRDGLRAFVSPNMEREGTEFLHFVPVMLPLIGPSLGYLQSDLLCRIPYMPVSTSNVPGLELVPETDGAVLRSEGREVGHWNWWPWNWKPSHTPEWPTPMACCASLDLAVAQQIADDLGGRLEHVWRLTIWQREQQYGEWRSNRHVGVTRALSLAS